MLTSIKLVSLKRRLLVSTLLVCLLISVAVSIYEVYTHQVWEKDRINTGIKLFQQGTIQEVAKAVWNYDWEMVDVIAQSHTNQLFSYVEICDSEVHKCLQQGQFGQEPFIDFRSKILYRPNNNSAELVIGQVYIQAAYKDFKTHLADDLLLTLFFNGLGVFAVAAVVLLLFHLQAIRRLILVEKYTRSIDLTNIEELESLDFDSQRRTRDEVDLLADSITGLTERIKDEFQRRQLLEKQLTQSQKMEALGTLAGGIAHDFNNVLAAILGYAQLCQTNTDPEAKNYKRLEQIVSAGQRAKTLISQILLFSRRSEARQEAIKLAEVVSEALTLIRASLPANIRIDLALERDLSIRGDATQLHQIIMNLAANASHAMAEAGGLLRVTLRRRKVDAELAGALSVAVGAYACLSLQDQGCGIPVAVQDRIFEPFFTTKQKGEGTGMGLAVVHGIVQAHNGGVAISSEPERGTRVDIYLPEDNSVFLADPVVEQGMVGGEESILLVDDEPAIIALGVELLQGLGYRVLVRTDPRLAVSDILSDQSIDLLLTDLTMPIMSGIDLAEKIRETNRQLPIVLWTGYADILKQADLAAVGIQQVLHKPFTLQGLARIVRQALDGRQAA